MLRLWPIPPRLPSGAQSPDRSAGFEFAAWLGAARRARGACALQREREREDAE